jgi:hypothetical protein
VRSRARSLGHQSSTSASPRLVGNDLTVFILITGSAAKLTRRWSSRWRWPVEHQFLGVDRRGTRLLVRKAARVNLDGTTAELAGRSPCRLMI